MDSQFDRTRNFMWTRQCDGLYFKKSFDEILMTHHVQNTVMSFISHLLVASLRIATQWGNPDQKSVHSGSYQTKF